ncbi:TIM barrel protein [Rhodobacteraceae bacterium NNCM2]|nr:TIM barrel protein [Coraliihabitans acroporae]
MKFSANLGFLWTDLSLPQAIRAASAAGFDAVECHWPYDEDPGAVKAALEETGLPMLGLNTVRGDVAAGETGLAAVPGRYAAAREAIDQAVGYAAAIGARNVHVMAGGAKGGHARATYCENLTYAADKAGAHGIGILIEPINTRDMPGYHLNLVEDGAEVIARVGRENLRLMFDCYHTQIMQGDLLRRIEAHLPVIGHLQFAAAPSRAEPDGGEVAFDRLIPAVEALGYDGYWGAEYKPAGAVEDGLGWLAAFRGG